MSELIEPPAPVWVDCTGDVVTGDTIIFTETVWGGSPRKPKAVGERTITAKVLKDSYGADKQQHTFTLEVLHVEGIDPGGVPAKTTRKGRNIYRNGTKRQLWQDETVRGAVADEKHARGDAARDVRRARRGF